jgi:hypothetical protein
LTGYMPVDGESVHGIVVAACIEAHVPAIERAPHLPPALSELIDACLAKSPADRPGDAAALSARLDEVTRDLWMGDAPVTDPTVVLPPAPLRMTRQSTRNAPVPEDLPSIPISAAEPPPRSRFWLAALAVAVPAAIALGAVALFSGDSGEGRDESSATVPVAAAPSSARAEDEEEAIEEAPALAAPTTAADEPTPDPAPPATEPTNEPPRRRVRPAPTMAPEPEPEPTPAPTPAPAPTPTPALAPTPAPTPTSARTPAPAPAPTTRPSTMSRPTPSMTEPRRPAMRDPTPPPFVTF